MAAIVSKYLKQERNNYDPAKLTQLFSNKKWDKTIKGLTGKKLAKVNKTDDSLLVELA